MELLTASSLCGQYALCTICNIFSVQVFRLSFFYSLLCDSCVLYTFHTLNELFLSSVISCDKFARGKTSCKYAYAITLLTTPAPTVLPPSRIANLVPSSSATGAISSTSILTLSPGITISVPSWS